MFNYPTILTNEERDFLTYCYVWAPTKGIDIKDIERLRELREMDPIDIMNFNIPTIINLSRERINRVIEYIEIIHSKQLFLFPPREMIKYLREQ